MAYRVTVCWDGGCTETFEGVEGVEARGSYLFMYNVGKRGVVVPFIIISDRQLDTTTPIKVEEVKE